MEIKENDVLTTKEMMSFFGATKDVWKRKREQLLQHFGNFYEYEIIYRGRNKDYHIIREIQAYKPIEKKSTIRDRIYENNIIQVISDDNIQTAMNVYRIIKNFDDIKSYNFQDSTIYEYTRVRMRNMFGVKVNQGGTRGIIEKKVWCRLLLEYNCYIEMPKEEVDVFYEMFKNTKSDFQEEELEIFSDYQNGLITKDEMNKQIGNHGFSCFLSAKNEFKQKYGYYPIKVPVYEISAYEREIDEYE